MINIKIHKLETQWVKTMPEVLEDGVLYISPEYYVAIHNCACGCGNKVVMTIDRDYGWILSYDGDGVSFSPSIGNFNFPCKSHYYIKNNVIEWC